MNAVNETLDSFIESLRNRNIFLKLNDNNNLEIDAPKGALDKEIIELMKLHKQQLIDYLKKRDVQTSMSEQIPIAPMGVSYPLSSAQTRVWVSDKIHGETTAYNLISSVELTGEFDPIFFEKSVMAVVDRYEILRTVFRKDEAGDVRQWISPVDVLDFKLCYFDWTNDDGAGKAEAFIKVDSQNTFDLENGPLFRIALFKLKKDKYILYYNLHHIICDAWSMNVLSENILKAYNAFKNLLEPNFPPLRIQYKDFAVWQQAQLETEAFRLSQQYWLSQFEGVLPELNLFPSTIRPAVQNTNGYVLSTSILHPSLVSKLKKMSGQSGGSLFIGLVASLKAILYKYSGQQDIIIGTPASGRDHADLHDQIGFYINTLALRTRFSGKENFQDLLNRVRETVMKAYDHQLYPFDRLIEDLKVKRKPHRSLLFDVFLNYEAMGDTSFPGQPVNSPKILKDSVNEDIQDMGIATSKFDLIFNFKEAGEGISLAVEFNRDIYSPEQISALIRNYKNLLVAVLNTPSQALASINYTSNTDLKLITEVFNNTAVDYPLETVVELFKKQVGKNADMPAVSDGRNTISYEQLDRKSNRLAYYLHSKGITKGSLVPILMHRSIDIIVAVLGILKAGAAYVPIDPAYPAERCAYILSDVDPTAIITEKYFETQLIDEDIEKIFIDGDDAFWESMPAEPLGFTFTEANLAYVMYTSGSTGTPKGVKINHGNLSNYLQWVLECYIPGANEGNFGLYSSFAFDLTVTSLFGSLVKGKLLRVFPSDDEISDVLKTYFDNNSGLDIIKLTPAHIQLIDSLDIVSTGVRKVIVGGDKLHRKHIEILRKINPEMLVYNEYGPTETAVGVTVAEIIPKGDYLHIGKPIANTQIHILDSHLNTTPVGVAGEIYIGGAQVSDGYWRREGLTADKFMQDPFNEGGRLYKTGDVGYWRADGNIEFLGRTDEQVKIRGHRVEPGEIENAICSDSAIKDAVVVTRETVEGDRELVAYIISGTHIEAGILQQYLKSRLPAYMIPARFMQVEEFPVNVNGKVDKERLPQVVDSPEEEIDRYVAPRNSVEEKLVEIWKEVLGLDNEISVIDNFFKLGGHSIKAIKMLSRVSKEFGIIINVQKLFEEPTIKELAEKVINAGWGMSEQIVNEDEYERFKI